MTTCARSEGRPALLGGVLAISLWVILGTACSDPARPQLPSVPTRPQVPSVRIPAYDGRGASALNDLTDWANWFANRMYREVGVDIGAPLFWSADDYEDDRNEILALLGPRVECPHSWIGQRDDALANYLQALHTLNESKLKHDPQSGQISEYTLGVNDSYLRLVDIMWRCEIRFALYETWIQQTVN